MRRPPATIVLGLALLAGAALPAGVRGAPAAGPKVRVVRVGAASVEGTFARSTPAEIVLDGVATPLDVATTRELRFAPDAPPRPLPERSTGLRVVLRGGEVIRGTLEAATVDELTVKPPDLAAMRLPFDAIRRVETESPDRRLCDEPDRLRPARAGTDVAYARSGDAYAGTVADATTKGLVIESSASKQTLAWADLVVLHLDEPALPPAKATPCEIETAGGSILLGEDPVGSVDGFTLTLRSGPKVSVPREALVAVRWLGGAFALVGALAFEATITPGYEDVAKPSREDLVWGLRVDRTPGGCPLRIGGVRYRHGISVHSKTSLRVPLGKAWTRFTCAFGIDDEVLTDTADPSRKGDVTARVLVDGKEAWSSKGSVRGGEAARVVGPIDVTGAEELVLEVDFGADQFTLDRADWAEPILSRGK